jgi:hypothetical protein
MHKNGENGNNMAESRDLETKRDQEGFERGRCPLCLAEEVDKHVLLKFLETKKWSEELVCSKLLNIDEDMEFWKIISCTNVTKIKTIRKCLFKTKCKWETKVGGGSTTSPPPPQGYLEAKMWNEKMD